MAKKTAITKTETAKAQQGAGLEEGAVVESRSSDTVVKEKVVFDYDQDDKYIGFHKEVVK